MAAAALLAAAYRLWHTSLEAREAANRIAREACSRAVVQLLDGTVAFAGFRLGRDAGGRLTLLRTYTFDYTSDGFERCAGLHRDGRPESQDGRARRQPLVSEAAGIDLHTHSSCSDGSLTPAELVERAAAAGVRVLALTDHDTLAGSAEARAAAERLGVRLVPGVELSACWRHQSIHVLGLWIDPDSAALASCARGARPSGAARACAECAPRLSKIEVAGR